MKRMNIFIFFYFQTTKTKFWLRAISSIRQMHGLPVTIVFVLTTNFSPFRDLVVQCISTVRRRCYEQLPPNRRFMSISTINWHL